MQASELIYMEGNFVTRTPPSRERKLLRELSKLLQFNIIQHGYLPQPKQFCCHVDTRRTQQYRHSGDADNRHSPVGLELTKGFSLLGGVHSHNITFRRRRATETGSLMESFPYS